MSQAMQKAEDMDKLVTHLQGQVDKLEKIHNERQQVALVHFPYLANTTGGSHVSGRE